MNRRPATKTEIRNFYKNNTSCTKVRITKDGKVDFRFENSSWRDGLYVENYTVTNGLIVLR